MKSILTGKTLLIVEDYPAMRKAIRDMLHTVGADVIVEAENGANALNTLSKQAFDIILCDYNLGAGKNGQQVLEEARHRNLIDHSAIFILITAEQTQAMVLGAMDSKPDEYLTKPFNAQQLYARIERNLQRKAYLGTVERDMALGRYPTAIVQCDRLLAEGHARMRMPLLRLRAELALLTDDNDTAASVYREVVMERDLAWARLGLGIVEFNQGQTAQAAASFADVIRDNPLCMEAYDWLAKACLQLGQPDEAESVLQQAVELSPQSIRRQKTLAATADSNGNVELALRTYKAVVALGKHSIHKSSSDFANLAKLYCKTQAIGDALSLLSQMRQTYPNDAEAELRALTLETAVYNAMGDADATRDALEKSLALSERLGNRVPKDLQLELIHACFVNDEAGHADTLMESLIKSHVDDDEFMAAVRTMHAGLGMEHRSEALIQATKKAMVSANNKAATLYKQGQYTEAMALLERAMVAMPGNKTLIMNALNIIIHDLKTTSISNDKILKAQKLLKSAKQLGVERHKLAVLEHEFVQWSHQRNKAPIS
ncbi:MAG: response regulator [Methylomonas sp.]|nr:response regulator [Methylomonas sp.]PPD20898.1 MAG: response regulator [Methylomonas sp.]PPD25600.1 MAG: response regulator [Methylomonas sp.]PPD36601.1 MAG: response regulator [Methylomonas sp.]PPD39930.1 MAG: response regulator [Methylomonas sp.]